MTAARRTSPHGDRPDTSLLARFNRWRSTSQGIVVLARIGATILAVVLFAVILALHPAGN